VTIYLVPVAASAAPSNTTTAAQTLYPGQTWNSPNEVGKVLLAGDALWAFSSVADAMTIMASGIQATTA
jgi:hypothetical protein